ncbi:hypothetical protein [Desulfovibrio sp. JC022]|uniref:hypothetical protein n=1 Tax=Desulfovibrio sp. JC022 TaxID=2593642 RepID=UPI0013D200E6|nr:hypothetical protein [Desulfovibrio sp. JC022]NDV22582.1 hypothetical protein [Desulfovibrio sp. JC022]
MGQPIKVYLDTQDYHNLAHACNSDLKEYLIGQRHSGDVEFVCGPITFFEFIQDIESPNGEYFQNRVDRAKFVGEFVSAIDIYFPEMPFPFSFEGLITWLSDLHFRKKKKRSLSSRVKKLKEHIKEVSAFEDKLSRMNELNLDRTTQDVMHYVFSRKPITRYLTNQLTKQGVDDIVTRMFRPDVIVNVLAVSGGISGFSALVDNIPAKMENFILQYRKEALKTDETFDDFRQKLLSVCRSKERYKNTPVINNILFWDIYSRYLFSYIKDTSRKVKRSDFYDAAQAVYLYECDLWRTDKSFAASIAKHEYKDRIVSKLGSLKGRIENLISH